MCVCVRACERACVRARARVRACVRVCDRLSGSVCAQVCQDGFMMVLRLRHYGVMKVSWWCHGGVIMVV